jgi:predicted RNase H-like HicB family nuclease
MIDRKVLRVFKARAAKPGADPYQTQINQALREYVSRGGMVTRDSRIAERSGRYSIAKAPSIVRPKSSRKTAARLQRTIKAVIRAGEQSGFVAECFEIPVVTQGATLDEVALNLKEAVALHLADEDLTALGLAPDPTIVATLELTATHA